jgi:hypothetical protein
MKTNLDNVAPLDPGCPHCGVSTAHPNSSRPAAPETARSNEAVKPKSKKAVSPQLARADGQFTYELFVTHVGHKEAAVSWDKLTGKAQQVWTSVARGVERRTVDMLLLQRAQFEQDSKRG